MTAPIARLSLVLTIAAAGAHFLHGQDAFSPVIPKTWDEDALATLEVPLPNPEFSPEAVPADYYYRIPVRSIYRGYPVYAPGQEPPGYFEALTQRKPEVIWDDGAGIRPRLETKADWISAGEAVFEAAIFYDVVTTAAQVRTTDWHAQVRPRRPKMASCRSPRMSFVKGARWSSATTRADSVIRASCRRAWSSRARKATFRSIAHLRIRCPAEASNRHAEVFACCSPRPG
jgi:hypothetical protein